MLLQSLPCTSGHHCALISPFSSLVVVVSFSSPNPLLFTSSFSHRWDQGRLPQDEQWYLFNLERSHYQWFIPNIALTAVVFPWLLLAYTGQATCLMNHPEHVYDAFYLSIPYGIYKPMFLVTATVTFVASHATISACFSIIKQALARGCLPRVNVVHTSKKFVGHIYIYIPDINWALMILCIIVNAGFQNTSQISNAYGNELSGSGGAYNSGCNHVTNAYVFSFWFLD